MTDRGYLHRRSDDYGKVPHNLIADTTISHGAVRLYAHMHWRYGSDCNNFESRRAMSAVLGVSKTTITKYIAELEQADWVIIVPRSSQRGRESNFYHVFELQEDCQQWRASHNRPKPTREVTPRKSRKGVGGNPTLKKSNIVEETTRNDNLSLLSYYTRNVNLSLLAPVNLSLPTPVNLSLRQYPDSRIIQTHEDQEESTNVDSLDHATANAASGPERKFGFEVGQQAWWIEEDKKTYQTIVHEITITRFTKQMVVFTYEFGGEAVEKMRKANALSKTRPKLERQTTPLQDAIAECIFKVPPAAAIGKNLNQRLRDWSKEILTTYPRLTAAHFRAAYAWKSPFTSRELLKVLAMLGEYRETLRSSSNGSRPASGPTAQRQFKHIKGCPVCNDGMVVDQEGKSRQCPECEKAVQAESMQEAA